MAKEKNDAFLILRVPSKIKEEIAKKAAAAKLTVSQYVRNQLLKILN